MPIFARDILHIGAPGLGQLLMARRRRHLRRAHPRIRPTISSAAPTPAFSRWRFCFIHHTIRSLREFSAFAPLAFFRGRISDHLLSSIATLLQGYTDESNRGRIMSLFGLQSRSWPNRELSLRPSRNLDRRSINSGNLWISDYQFRRCCSSLASAPAQY